MVVGWVVGRLQWSSLSSFLFFFLFFSFFWTLKKSRECKGRKVVWQGWEMREKKYIKEIQIESYSNRVNMHSYYDNIVYIQCYRPIDVGYFWAKTCKSFFFFFFFFNFAHTNAIALRVQMYLVIHRKSVGWMLQASTEWWLLGRPKKKNTWSKGDRGGPAKNPPILRLVSLKFLNSNFSGIM